MHSEAGSTLAVPDIIYPITSILDRIDPATAFPRNQPLHVELGSGDGSFLANFAAQHLERNFIGVERLLGRLRKLEKKARKANLSNLRAVRIESAYFLRYLLPSHCVEALHIYFPDPWPKRKHARHRLVSEAFVAVAQRALQPNGVVYLRTDDVTYFGRIREVFAGAHDFAPTETPNELAEVRTDFEIEFNQRGIATLRAAYRAVPVT